MTLSKIQFGNTGRRNMIINGAMQIAQRGTSSSNIGSSGYYTVDRVDLAMSTTAGRFTQSQVTDAPDGFSHALKFDCTTADTSVAAGETTIVMWQLEGQNVQQMAKGTSSAKQVTVSFYAKANASKTYICELKDFTNTRTVSKAFTVGTSYTRHEITFPADTTGAITSDTAKQFAMNIWLHAGSTYTSGSLQTTWGAQTNANRCVGIDSFFSSTDNTFFITGVQMEVGDTVTEFEHRSVGEELALCQRYFYRREIGIYDIVAIGHALGDRGGYVLHTPTLMRAKPSVSQGSHIYCWYNNAGAVTPQNGLVVGYMATNAKDINQFYLRANSNSTVQTGYGLGLTMYDGSATSSHIALDSEL